MTDEAKLSTYRGDWRNLLLAMVHWDRWSAIWAQERADREQQEQKAVKQ